MITILAPQPKRGRGRPPKPEVDPRLLDVLTIPEVLEFCRSTGRGLGRKKITAAIVSRALQAQVDQLHNDRYGRPLLMICRKDLESWLANTLKPFNPARILGVVAV